MLKIKSIILALTIIGIGFSRTFLISDDSSHPLGMLATYFNNTPSILYSNEIAFLDTLNTITEDDFLFWEKNIQFTEEEKEFVSNFNSIGGSLALFGKSIFEDSNFFIENFGGTFLRNNFSNYLILDADTINFLLESATIELQQIDLNSSIIFQYSNYEIASIQNASSNFLLNGFWLEELQQEELPSFIEILLNTLNQKIVDLSIGSIECDGNLPIDFQIRMANQQSIKEIVFILNVENDYLSNFNISSTERSLGMDWNIIDLPFGNIKILAEFNSAYISEGEGAIAIVETTPSSNAVGKIALQLLESTILDSADNELPVNNNNGEINFSSDLPVLYFSENNSVQLGQVSSIELNLKNDIPVSGFQLCFEFDSENILFVQGIQSERIPDDWWVGQFGLGSNDEIQFASLGWSDLPAGDGPILNIEFMSVGENSEISQIGYCGTYLFNSDSQGIESQYSSTEITIYSPQIFITPKVIHSENYTDIILSYITNNEFSGFQLDLLNTDENPLELFSYFGSYITGNLIDGTTNRILGFTQNEFQNFPESGRLFVTSFNYLNTLENYVEFDNLMFSDNQGEIIYSGIQPVIMNEFSFGDIDSNGELDIKDLLILNQNLVSDIELGLAQLENSDINLDGNISIVDIVILLQELIR